MSGWLLNLVYLVGYLMGVAYAVTVARRAHADKRSMLWDYEGERVDASIAVMCGLGVLFLPLLWPIIGIGMLGWQLVVHKRTDTPSVPLDTE